MAWGTALQQIRSWTLVSKLTLSFVFIGLVTALLALAFIRLQSSAITLSPLTRQRSSLGFNYFVESYYANYGTLDGIEVIFSERDPAIHVPPAPLAVVDLDNKIVYGDEPFETGESIDAFEDFIGPQFPVLWNDEIIAYIVLGPPVDGTNNLQESLNRTLNWGTVLTVVVSGLLSLLIGRWLARTITRPLANLTAASEKIAKGELRQMIETEAQDEVGRLTTAFNKMSHDLDLAQTQRQQLTADLAHEIRTPLTVLMGYTEPLSEGRMEATPEVLETIHHEVAYFGHLVGDLRILSLAEAGELTLNKRPVEIRALFERTALAYMGQAQENGVEILLDLLDNLPLIEVDVQRMTQILKNLVSNALRYTMADDVIRLGARQTMFGVEITVTDTGSGIPQEHLPHIFDRFYQVDPARTRIAGGTSGLGLTIVKSIVEAHGGRIAVSSGKETIFTIALRVV